jgi:hypothetical protein
VPLDAFAFLAVIEAGGVVKELALDGVVEDVK